MEGKSFHFVTFQHNGASRKKERLELLTFLEILVSFVDSIGEALTPSISRNMIELCKVAVK